MQTIQQGMLQLPQHPGLHGLAKNTVLVFNLYRFTPSLYVSNYYINFTPISENEDFYEQNSKIFIIISNKNKIGLLLVYRRPWVELTMATCQPELGISGIDYHGNVL